MFLNIIFKHTRELRNQMKCGVHQQPKLPALATSHSTGCQLTQKYLLPYHQTTEQLLFLMLWHYSIHSLDATKRFNCTTLHCIMGNKWNLSLEETLTNILLCEENYVQTSSKARKLERPVVGTINHPWHLQLHTWVRSVKRQFLPKWSFYNEKLYRLKPQLILLARPPSQAALLIHLDLIVVAR